MAKETKTENFTMIKKRITEEAEKNTAETKKLLNKEKNALRALNDVLHYDFEKPHTIIYFKGAFTIKKVLDIVSSTAHTEPQITLLVKNPGEYRPKYHLLTVDKFGKIEIEYKIKWALHCNFDLFFRKSDFEAMRKKADTETFVIVQNTADLVTPKPEIIDKDKRYIYIPSVYEKAGDAHGNAYINRIQLQRTDEKGTIFEYKTEPGYFYDRLNRTNNLYDIIDKSGYLLQHRRQELKRRAAALRAERQKAAYMETDNTAKIAELAEKIHAAKTRICEALTQAKTADQIHDIGKILYWSFARIASDFERYQANTTEKAYHSIEQSETAYQAIIKSLDELEM